LDKFRKIEYWLDIAQYDMDTARAMHENGRYLYAVFMCQQATEKILKANYIQKCNKEAPMTHNIIYLASLLDLILSPEQNETASTLTTYYIEGRYPSYKKKLSILVDSNKSYTLLKQTEALFQWLKSLLQL
jgi:HEPN domain-containing protein